MSVAALNRASRSEPDHGSHGPLRLPGITESIVPIPTDELIDQDHVERIRHELMELSMAQPCNLEDVEGTSARIFRSGRVSIGSEWATVLRFRIGQKPAQDMLGSAAQVRVHLGEFSLQLKNNSTVLYTKPYERLLASAQGPEWLVQLVHQQNIARRPGFSDLSPSTAPGPHSSAITPHNVSLEEHWKNPELRHRLLRGDIFKCTRRMSLVDTSCALEDVPS